MKQVGFLKQFLLLTIFCAGLQVMSNGQEIHGIIKDNTTKQPVGFSNIIVAHTRIGTSADAEGKFKITLPYNIPFPDLIITAIGYKADTMKLSAIAAGHNIIFLTPREGILNGVVVTGVSKATIIRKNPVAILSVSQKEINQTLAGNVIDAIAINAADLQTVKTGPNVSKPFINGLGYNRVLTLYDGLLRVETQQWGDEHGIPMDDYIVDKAEVIEGPASLMYGSDAIGGVLSLFTAIPKETDRLIHGRFLSEYQANNGLIGNSLSLTMGSNHWSYALRGSERIARNYTNPVDGRVYNTGFKMVNASAFLGYKNLNGYSHLNLTFYNNRQGIPDGSRDSLTRRFTYQVYESPGENTKLQQVDTITNRPLVPRNILNSYKISPLSQRIQDYRIYTDNLYHLGQSDIKALLGFEQNIRREFDHPTDVAQAGEYIVLNTLDYGLLYNAPVILNIDFSAGLNGMYQINTTKTLLIFLFLIIIYLILEVTSMVNGNIKNGA